MKAMTLKQLTTIVADLRTELDALKASPARKHSPKVKFVASTGQEAYSRSELKAILFPEEISNPTTLSALSRKAGIAHIRGSSVVIQCSSGPL